MPKMIAQTVLLLLAVIFMPQLYAEEPNQRFFQQLFEQWTQAFNHRELVASCDLFSKDVIADYRGVPTKNYESICQGFKKIFALPNRQYHYRFKLHQVYSSQNLAAVRITWYLDIYDKQKLTSTTQDEGLDVFEKNAAGEWKIVNYIGYKVH